MVSAFGISLPWLAYLVVAYILGRRLGGLSDEASQTLAFLSLVFVGSSPSVGR